MRIMVLVVIDDNDDYDDDNDDDDDDNLNPVESFPTEDLEDSHLKQYSDLFSGPLDCLVSLTLSLQSPVFARHMQFFSCPQKTKVHAQFRALALVIISLRILSHSQPLPPSGLRSSFPSSKRPPPC